MSEIANGVADAEAPVDQTEGDKPEDQSTEPNGKPEGDGDKPKEEAPDGVPEEYAAFELPEGMELDETLLGKATPLMKELGLNQEKAQKAASFIAELRQADAQAMTTAHQEQVTNWETQCKQDKAFGGDGFEQNAGLAKSAIDALGTPELKTFLDESGVGNHPELFKLMVKVGKTLAEDNPGDGKAPDREKTAAEILYPSKEN